MKSRSNPYLE